MYNRKTITSLAVDNYKIYLITMDKTIQYWYKINQGVSDMSGLTGISYIWDAPQERVAEKQIAVINNAVKNGAQALMIAAIDPVQVSSAIENAKAYGVKIIYVDLPANVEGIVTLATDNYGAGITAGKSMLFELESHGIKNGSIGIVSINPETSTTSERLRGFRNFLMEDGRFPVLPTEYAGISKDLALAKANNLITDHQDLVGMLGTDENSTIGVGDAIKSSNKEIIGVGFDLTTAIEERINDGSLKAVMVQNPYTMGYLGMAETIAALKGFNTGPPFINTGVFVKTKYSH